MAGADWFGLIASIAVFAYLVYALLREVWGRAYGDESHYLHVYVSQLRRKLEPDPARPRYILTEPGAGYRLVDPAS